MRFDDRCATTGSEAGSPEDRHAAVVPAWLLRDVTHVPGVLSLDGDRCRFVSTRRVVFDATLDELALATSRTRRGRFRLTVDGERIGLSVVRPAGAVPVPAELLARTSGALPSSGPGVDGPAPDADDAAVTERWEHLLATATADATGRPPAGPATPRAWRAVAALLPRLSLVAGRPRGDDRSAPPMVTA